MTSMFNHTKFCMGLVGAIALPLQAADQLVVPEVSVTGKQDALTVRQQSNTQKVILNRQEIDNLGVMTIGEVLGKLPGVDMGGQGDGGSARARGMARESVDIRVDGERPAGGGRMISGVVGRLPAGDLERVEILRGSSAEFGGSAPVTVNLIMKKALSKKSTALKAGVGFRGDEPNTQLTWTENNGSGGFSWSVPVTLNLHRTPSGRSLLRQDYTAGTRTALEGERDDGLQTFREFVITPRLTWKKERDTFSLSPLFFDGRRVTETNSNLFAWANPADASGLMPDGDRANDEKNHRQLMRLRAEGEKFFGGSKLSGRMAYNYGKTDLDVLRQAHDAANVLTTTIERTRGSEREINSALRWDQPLGEHYVSISTEYVHLTRQEDQAFDGSFVDRQNHDASEREFVLWAQDEWTPVQSLTLTAGLRLEDMQYKADNAAHQETAWLPSLAVRWEPMERWVMRSSLGAGLKLPKLDEISNATTRSVTPNAPLEADRRGNPALLPERSLNFEWVLERYLAEEAGVLGANLYVRSTQDFIERRTLLEGVRWVDRPYNVGDALHWGWELDGKVRTDRWGWKGATIKGHLTLPHARVEDDRLGITRTARETPNYMLSFGLDQSLPAWNSSYGVSAQIAGRTDTDIPGERWGSTQARTLLDAYWLLKLNPKFNLRLSGQNLLGAETVRDQRLVDGANAWLLDTTDKGPRTLLLTLEGRW